MSDYTPEQLIHMAALADSTSLADQLRAHAAALEENAKLKKHAEAMDERERTFRGLIADDAYAASFQSLGQYRTSLLGWIDEKNDIDSAGFPRKEET